MAQDKNKKPEQPPEDTQLVHKIDQMMDPKTTESTSTPAPELPKSTEQPPAIDIFKDTKTAPKVSPDLLKEIGVKDAATEEKTVTEASNEPEADQANQPQQIVDEPEITDEEPFDDKETDKAVDEIASQDGDILLDSVSESGSPDAIVAPVKKKRRLDIKKILKSKKFWAITLVLLIVVFGVPYTRYKAIGLVYKAPVVLTLTDTQTHTPVSNAGVTINGTEVETDGSGVAKFKARPGESALIISKKYYKTYNQKQFIGLKGNKNLKISVTATGRQVPITVLNSITGEPIRNAEIKAKESDAKTDKNGKAILVVPASNSKQEATIDFEGFNTVKSELIVTDKVDSKNTFKITPKGKVYFLSNLSGSLDVVKSDLDGKNRKVVLDGTGKEDARSTSLLAARDWRYLVLKSRRDTATPALYLIDTQSDTVTKIDSGAGEYTLIGWYGHSFIYDVVKSNLEYRQAGKEVLKSYNAERGEPNQIDQSQAEGPQNAYSWQQFNNFYILDNLVAYNTTWYAGGPDASTVDLSSKKSTIRGATPTGQNKKDYQNFNAKDLSYFSSVLYAPEEVYYAAYDNNGKPTFYELENQKVSETSTVATDDFTKAYPTYLISPTGKQAFWSDYRDGKNTLFVGDPKNIDSKKQVATLSEYAPYGWYSDEYLMVSKSSSELYITTQKNFSSGKAPLKITDYYKPSQNFSGYGYGYGGL